MKDVKDWTDEEALVHAETMLKVFEHERLTLLEGMKAGSLWAQNRGSESAFVRFAELIQNYQRIVNVLTNKIRICKGERYETPRTFSSLEGK